MCVLNTLERALPYKAKLPSLIYKIYLLVLTCYKKMDGAKALDVLSDFQIEEMQAMQPIDLGLLSSKDNCHKKKKKKTKPACCIALHTDSRMESKLLVLNK